MIVTHEQAKKLSDLGFCNNEVDNIYHPNGTLSSYEYWDYYLDCPMEYDDSDLLAPTVEDALDYLREEHFFMGYVEMENVTIKGGNRKYSGKYRGVIVGAEVEEYLELEGFDYHNEACLNLLTVGLDIALMRKSIKEGDYFTMSKLKGYSPAQRKTAMQIMECGNTRMTVRCGEDGCITQPFYHFEKIEDITQYKVKFNSPNLEDYRTKG